MDTVEPSFAIRGEPINDLILTAAQENQSLLIDCKSYTLSPKQSDRYQLALDNKQELIFRGEIAVYHPDDFTLDFAYSSFGDLQDNYDLSDYDFTTIEFKTSYSEYSVRFELTGTRGFQHDALTDAFPIDVSLEDDIPTHHYPFSTEEEDQEVFATAMLRNIVKLAKERGNDPFSVTELLKQSHPFWQSIGNEEQKAFRTIAEDFVTSFQKEGLNQHLRKVKIEDEPGWFHTKQGETQALQALKRKTDDLIADWQARLEQKDLTDF